MTEQPQCPAEDEDADLSCIMPEDHVGGHLDPDMGEWANDISWCPSYMDGRVTPHKYFCIKPRNHNGDHVSPITGQWPQEERPVPTLKAGEDIAAGDPVALYPVDDFPCCSNGGHKQYKPATCADLIVPKAVVEFSARVALKRARMARRPVTKP